MADEREGAPRADGDQGALHDDRSKAPLGYHAIFALPLLAVVVTALAGKAPLVVPLASIAVLLLSWLLFSALRVTVSERDVHVRYGLFGPKIPVADITRCEAVAHDWKAHGGWGIRYGRDGSRAYDVLGDPGRAVRIAYKKGKKERVVILASRDPGRLEASIQAARAIAAAKMPVVSVPVAPVESMPIESMPIASVPVESVPVDVEAELANDAGDKPKA